MLRSVCYLLALGLLVIPPRLGHAQQGDDLLSRYRLASGDVISIFVLGEEDLKREKVRLTDAGTIQYAVLGEIRIKGLTAGELEQKITSGLIEKRYLLTPKVSVNIDEYARSSSTAKCTNPGLSLRSGAHRAQGGIACGGFKDRASKSNMYVVRDGAPNDQRKKVVLDSVIYPGDILTIEESFF